MASLKETLDKGLVSLKMPSFKPKKSEPDCCPEEIYPYGTSIELRKEQITALGLKLEDLAVGQVLTLTGKARLQLMSESENTDSYSQQLTLQITDLKITE
jgi:hypothetical protein